MAADDDTDSNSESDSGLGSAAGNGPVGNDDDHEHAAEFADEGRDDAAEVDGTDEAGDGADDTSEQELVGVGARTGAGRDADADQETTGKKSGTKRQKKEGPTPRQHGGSEQPKRTTPASFVRGSVGELRKVVYPTRQQLGNYFVVVLVFVMLVIAIVSALDYGFGAIIVRVF